MYNQIYYVLIKNNFGDKNVANRALNAKIRGPCKPNLRASIVGFVFMVSWWRQLFHLLIEVFCRNCYCRILTSGESINSFLAEFWMWSMVIYMSGVVCVGCDIWGFSGWFVVCAWIVLGVLNCFIVGFNQSWSLKKGYCIPFSIYKTFCPIKTKSKFLPDVVVVNVGTINKIWPVII